MKLRPRSLRTRLIALAVALVAFGVFATGIATYSALRGYLLGQLDRNLVDAADGVLASYTPGRGLGAGPPARRFGAATEAALVTPDGTVRPIPLSIDDTGIQITSDQAVAVSRAEDPVSVHPPSGQTVRAMAQLLPDGSRLVIFGPGGRTVVDIPDGSSLVTTLPMGDLDSTLGKLLALEVIGGLVVVAAVFGLGTLGVRLGLRPLDRVTRTAQEVAAELSPDGSGLDKRVEVIDPDTEVGQLAEAVNTMLDAVETEYAARYESEQRMRRFLADASHELRTPLTSLRGYAELIRLRGKEGTDADARDALRRIEAEGTRMSRLVDDLLTLARHDRGVIPLWEPVALTDVVADAVAGVHAAHPERTITMVDPGTPATVLGDHDQLLQIVRNVITNAAVHTPSGPITVTVATPSGEVVVAVRDTGPGLPPEQAAHVFDRFWRADLGRIRSRGGSGLGLSIVQALAAQHGGRATFETSPAAGTTVTIHLPAAPVGPPAAAADAGPPAVPHVTLPPATAGRPHS